MLRTGGICDARRIDTWNIRDNRDGTGVHDNRGRSDSQLFFTAGDQHGMRAGELCMAVNDKDAGVIGKLLVDLVQGGDKAIAVLNRTFVIHAALGIYQHGLGRDTRNIDAGAAVHFRGLLHQNNAVAVLRAVHGDGLAGLTKTDNQHIRGSFSLISCRCHKIPALS